MFKADLVYEARFGGYRGSRAPTKPGTVRQRSGNCWEDWYTRQGELRSRSHGPMIQNLIQVSRRVMMRSLEEEDIQCDNETTGRGSTAVEAKMPISRAVADRILTG